MGISYVATGIHEERGAGPKMTQVTDTSYRCAVVGPGRMGSALTNALARAGWPVEGPLDRGANPRDADVVLLAVPDSQIEAAASALTPRATMVVGHLSGATTLAPLSPHDAFSLHPLMTVTGADTSFDGAAAALAASSPRSREVATRLAETLGLSPFEVEDHDRAAYHAGASVASNFLLAVLDMAEQVAGIDRAALAPLAHATVENWEHLGAERALTGPIARGDTTTVARQRSAVAERTPELLETFDELVAQTERLAGRASEVMA
jgi:predicted short-subunit dehydrogenase-like oxidoreductase (DUF2520 family)